MINTLVGKYRITRLIAEGGMAAVFEAEHELLGSKAAMKVLNPVLSASPQIRERFKNEARLMASLKHPNITQVLDYDEEPQRLCIVMELLEGEDLNQRIRRSGPLRDAELSSVFSQALSALQYAHEKGVVHRDIKPSNIYIQSDGLVKILDFGIAKLYGQGKELTQTGTQMGTPVYMSPEQVRETKTIDHRSDIYSLGVTLFFAVTGQPPYDTATKSQFDIYTKIVNEPLPPLNIKNGLDGLIRKACEKDREHRFQSCSEFQLALNKKRDNPSPSQPNPRPEPPLPSDSTIIETPTTTPGIIRIGELLWMDRNLITDIFQNGDPILEAKTERDWKKAGQRGIPAWCYYNNDPHHWGSLGKLYNWFAVNDPRGLAPEGWHIPTDEEWSQLIAFQGGKDNAGDKLKSKSGWREKGNGSDNCKFAGLPAGYRSVDGYFGFIGQYGYWWSSTEVNGISARECYLIYSSSKAFRTASHKACGFSVRCIRHL